MRFPSIPRRVAGTTAAVLLATAGALHSADTSAQARGPSAKEVQEEGQRIEYEPRGSGAGLMQRFGVFVPIETAAAAELAELDEAGRASKNQEHTAWLARLPGRFRIGGRAEKLEFVSASGQNVPVAMGVDISGIADCSAIGEGAGVHCVLNATWPIIEPASGSGLDALRAPPPASERVGVFRPAVLVLGLDPGTAQIRASMVTDNSVAHTWAGRLQADTLTARRSSSCMEFLKLPRFPPPPCFQPLQIVAGPDGEVVTMVHSSDAVVLRLSLQRDPAARAEKPMKTRKVR